MPWLQSRLRTTAGAVLAGAIVALFCLILLWHDPLIFWNDDYEVSILPVFADVARSWNEGQLPLLSPYSWVCANLAGEYQYGTFSLFVNAAVVLIWKLPLLFWQQAATLSIVHLFVLAAGAFLLARDRKLPGPLSTLVALVAALSGWNICWGATDWFGAIGAFAWLPWAWWGMERALDEARGRWRFAWPAPFVYLVATGGFPYTVVMLAVIAGWIGLRTLLRTRRVTTLMPLIVGLFLGFGMATPALLALLEYVRGSGRAQTSATAHWQWLVPWRALPGFLLPCWTVPWADFSTRYVPHTSTELACGLVPPVALLAGLLQRPRQFVRGHAWDLMLFFLLLLVSMLPSAGVFRWSFRWLPLIHLVLALLAAEALRDGVKPGLLGLIAVGISLVAMQFFGVSGVYGFPLAWILLALAGVWMIAERYPWRGAQWIPSIVALAALLATYICIPPNCGVPKYNLSQQLTEPVPLSHGRLYLSVYPAAEYAYRSDKRPGPVGQVVRPGSTSMWAALRFVNGYSPILTAGVARSFDFAIHGEFDLNVGDYLVRNQSGRGGILEQLGVDGLVIAQEVLVNPVPEEWEQIFSNEEGRVFHRRGQPYPPVRAVTGIDTRPEQEFGWPNIHDIHDARNAVHCDVDAPTDGPALLTFSRPFFPGYKASFNGEKLEVQSYRGLIPMVELPAGAHGRLLLTYRPDWLIYGGAFAIFCALVTSAGWMMMLRKTGGQEAGKPEDIA